jgi:hypothetical protein
MVTVRKPKPSKDESRVLRLVSQALEGEGPDCNGIGPLLRQTAFLGERLAQRLGVNLPAMVQERTDTWRAHYGRLDLATDARDFQMEALEEFADALFYLSAAALQRGAR